MSTLVKNIFRDWCPPKLRFLINKFRGIKVVTNTYEGVFKNFYDCSTACKSESIYMDSLSDESEGKAFWDLISSDPGSIPIIGRNIIIPILVGIKKEKSIALLDVGGGSSPVISKIAKKHRKNIDYFVLDRPEVGNIIRKYGDESGIKVVDSLEDVYTTAAYKIIYFGSSVQYFHEDNKLEAFFAWGADVIIFADSVFSANEDIWVKQINIIPLEFPNHWWSIKKIISIASLYQYDLINQMITSTGKHLHATLGKCYNKTLVFERDR